MKPDVPAARRISFQRVSNNSSVASGATKKSGVKLGEQVRPKGVKKTLLSQKMVIVDENVLDSQASLFDDESELSFTSSHVSRKPAETQGYQGRQRDISIPYFASGQKVD